MTFPDEVTLDVSAPLLFPDEPAPFIVENRTGHSPFLILCDHGGKRIPRRLGDLGLPQSEIDRHIGWDIGVLAVSRHLSQLLNAPLVHQIYSRLVIDCNRNPGIPSSIPTISEATLVPGNMTLSQHDRDQRQTEIFEPYHAAIREILAERKALGIPTCLLAMHSFTPVFHGEQRPWEIGVLYQHKADYALAILEQLQQSQRWTVGDNQPYSVSDETDYAVPQHAVKNDLHYVEIELRQDLIGHPAGQLAWAEDLAPIFTQCWEDIVSHQFKKEA